ncbi:CGG triplet repeat-binding protein 1-like [Diabrotica virgifera virgifera]|uniref:Uncharacterized protein n=1 Tax=Diabrotica virgifera virgifera TaxID=50390 RepID=A0ABM5L0U6_DIAVI|nr:CGG triplet repeat-binding protein 1-like [Diabrotica virgifera virgifera]
MAKIVRNATWIKDISESEFSGEKACSKIIVCEKKKFQVDQHLETALHIGKVAKMKYAPVQQNVKNAFQNVGAKSDKELFQKDLCQTMMAANIPLRKRQHPRFRSFLQRHCN